MTGGLLTQGNYSEKCTFCGVSKGGVLTQVVLRTGSTVFVMRSEE